MTLGQISEKMLRWDLRPFSTLCWSFKSIALGSTKKRARGKVERKRKKREKEKVFAATIERLRRYTFFRLLDAHFDHQT